MRVFLADGYIFTSNRRNLANASNVVIEKGDRSWEYPLLPRRHQPWKGRVYRSLEIFRWVASTRYYLVGRSPQKQNDKTTTRSHIPSIPSSHRVRRVPALGGISELLHRLLRQHKRYYYDAGLFSGRSQSSDSVIRS